MTAKEVLVNVRGYGCYDIEPYPLQEKEAIVIIKALERMAESGDGEQEQAASKGIRT